MTTNHKSRKVQASLRKRTKIQALDGDLGVARLTADVLAIGRETAENATGAEAAAEAGTGAPVAAEERAATLVAPPAIATVAGGDTNALAVGVAAPRLLEATDIDAPNDIAEKSVLNLLAPLTQTTRNFKT